MTDFLEFKTTFLIGVRMSFKSTNWNLKLFRKFWGIYVYERECCSILRNSFLRIATIIIIIIIIVTIIAQKCIGIVASSSFI